MFGVKVDCIFHRLNTRLRYVGVLLVLFLVFRAHVLPLLTDHQGVPNFRVVVSPHASRDEQEQKDERDHTNRATPATYSLGKTILERAIFSSRPQQNGRNGKEHTE